MSKVYLVSLKSWLIVSALSLTVSVGTSSIEKISSNKFSISKPSSKFVWSIDFPSNTF